MKLKKQILSEEFQRFQKLAGITNENIEDNDEFDDDEFDDDEDEDGDDGGAYDDFMDKILNLALDRGIISPIDSYYLNRGERPELMGMLEDLYDENFKDYAETGQSISTSDYNSAIEKLDAKIKQLK